MATKYFSMLTTLQCKIRSNTIQAQLERLEMFEYNISVFPINSTVRLYLDSIQKLTNKSDYSPVVLKKLCWLNWRDKNSPRPPDRNNFL